MKKILFLLTLLVLPLSVNGASCSTTEKASLITKANLLNFNYVEEEGYYTGEEVGYPETLDEEDYADYKVYYEYFVINILNLSEEFYIKVSNNVNNEVFYIYYDDIENGMYSFNHQTLSDVTTYQFDVYSSSETECEDELITVKYLLVPKYNEYSTLTMCLDNPDESVCQKYTTVSTYTESYVFEKLTSNSSEEKEETTDVEDENLFSLLNENIVYIILGGISIVAIAAVIVVVRKKRSDLK